MRTSPVSEVVQHLRRTALLRHEAELTDEQLLEDYLNRHDEAALAALVRRHGPMVWGVCRRVLLNYHDAEDAFQVTFLVFVRKAASITSKELLANWLYGVAHQTALKTRATATRRAMRETQVTDTPEPEAVRQDLWHDLQPLLDQELSRLPDKYRILIVLCDLEGKTRKEVAQQLDCPEGTVAGRLSRARTILAARLARRGVVVSGAMLAAILSQNTASACVPVTVVTSTIAAASLYAVGQEAVAGVISAQVHSLTEAVLNTALPTKLNILTALFVMVPLLGAVGAVGDYTRVAEHTQAAQKSEMTKNPLANEDRFQHSRDLFAIRKTGKEIPKEPSMGSRPFDEQQHGIPAFGKVRDELSHQDSMQKPDKTDPAASSVRGPKDPATENKVLPPGLARKAANHPGRVAWLKAHE